ncbi:MAG TPA: hypothetical protein VEK56_18380 [Vicinamibacterales bacterium]|nr:hypothetical protein [Vicinamibacterales bacterium]
MNILLLSTGGGGGNILRSLKTLFARDVAVAQKTDARYAERLRRAITTRFLDTNEFSLADLPKEERVLIGAVTTQRLGSRHSPDVALRALDESQADVERLLARYSVVILIGTGGKGTGAGTMFPLAQIARAQQKLVIPVFVRPSFERHEVDKRRYDHALRVTGQFDAARIRLIEILNDRGYSDRDPQSQAVVWERMNLPIARSLRGLLYVLWDLSQVDPSDLSMLLAGDGRLRIGFSEIDPAPHEEPGDAAIETAVRCCWDNPYYAFSRPVGTSLVCIQGDWSNLVDAKIKGRLAALALEGSSDNPYNPLYARAFQTPKPWGITALFAEHTGVHEPLQIDWSLQKKVSLSSDRVDAVAPESIASTDVGRSVAADESGQAVAEAPLPRAPLVDQAASATQAPAFNSIWDFARALNRADSAALALAANAGDARIPVDGGEVKKLLGTFWFRSVFPLLSTAWRDRLLDTLLESVVIPNHEFKVGRQTRLLSELSHAEMKEFFSKTLTRGTAGIDLQLLLAIGSLWGEDVVHRIRFAEPPPGDGASRLATLLSGVITRS